jgi:alkanesulfonate monooxygenase SsuD/methylene tetrahydromethanopterin reductase-like flavin-dependent oxidoreductase (luciferase family)
MDLSFFIQPLHPIDRNYADVLQEDLAAIILADKFGYKEALIGEHFTDLAKPITSSIIFIARLIAETKTIKLGSGIT